jgi:hypothetical protein
VKYGNTDQVSTARYLNEQKIKWSCYCTGMDSGHKATRRWKYCGSVSCCRQGETGGNETRGWEVGGKREVRFDEKQEISLRE